MVHESTMGSSGIMRQGQDSYSRAIATVHAKPSETIRFQAATHQQILDALREEEFHGKSLTLDLAEHGLYNPKDTMTLFHPGNIELSRYLIDEFAPNDIGPSESGYRLSRKFHQRLLDSIKMQPGSAWLQ